MTDSSVWWRKLRPYPLVEVFSVRFDSNEGDDAGNLYGTIKVTSDDHLFMFLYNRESEECESIKPGEILSLVDLSRCIDLFDESLVDVPVMSQCTFACDDFIIHVDIWFSPDHECIRGEIGWFACDRRTDFNVPLSSTFSDSGARRSLTVNYAVFCRGVLAKVDVKLINAVLQKKKKKKRLINADGKVSAHVYGLLEGHENLLSKEIRLFQVDEPTESVKVKCGERISLSRSVMVVSAESYLTVKAKLFDYDPDPDPDPDPESESGGNLIADGSVNFRPEYYGRVRAKISGDYGEIEVIVTWLPTDFDYASDYSE